MQADAYRRARRLLNDRSRAVVMARILGTVHSLLVLMLLIVAGLLGALLATRGEARLPSAQLDSLPTWVQGRVTGTIQDVSLFDDTGLFPLVAANLSSHNPLHRRAARLLLRILGVGRALTNNFGALTSLLATASGLLLILCVLAQSQRAVLAEAVSEVATSFRRQIHRQMYRLGQLALPSDGTGPIVNLLTREVNDVRDGMYAELDGSFRLPVLAGGLVAIALFLSPVLTVFLASLVGLAWYASTIMNRDARRVSDAAMRDAALHLCLIHEDLGLLRTVRVYGMEDVDKQRFDEHLERYRAADARRIKTEGRLNTSTGLLCGVSTIAAISVLSFSVLVTRRVGPSTALMLAASLSGLVHPLLEWQAMRRAVRLANSSARGIFEFLERRPELQQQGGAQFLPPIRERITFEDVMLLSASGRTLLDGVSAEIPAGSRTAIMGLDEDAKLAMVCLIPRLIDPKVGRVRIDGLDLRDVTLESIRAQVATVLQADLVFTDSVTMNIGLGDPGIEMPRIIEAAKVAHAHHFIQSLPHGYDTIIGPLSHTLEPDEQFRIALARASLHDPSILIIEEPNLPLDDIKHLIDDTLARLSEGRTLIVLPHRLETIRSCQQIIVLQDGRVESVGQPRQLQSESKLYRHIQYVEFNSFATGAIATSEIEPGQLGV